MARSLAIALVITAVVGPVGAWSRCCSCPSGALAFTSFTTCTTYAVWRRPIGSRWALPPAWLLFVLVSSPASGSAVEDPLLPPALAAIGGVLPTGAAVAALRDLTYFWSPAHALPCLVLAV